ncbi:hypothetical protein EB093_07035 [bacterium]|nr:hypothetical protein [bacterium]
MELWITSNSPGELSAWVDPVVRTIQSRNPDVQITVALVPCQYATGTENTVAAAIPGVDSVLTVSDTLRLIVGRLPRPTVSRRGVVVYLGGDPLYAKLLGWKLKWPVLAYTEHDYRLGWGITRVFRRREIGDLMAARIALAQPVHRTNEFDMVFFLGSRPHHFRLFAPFCLAVAAVIKTRRPDYRLAVQRSPFITDDLWRLVTDDPHVHVIEHTGTASVDTLARSRLMVSLPGTSTAEAMYMRTPMMVLVPLNRPDLIQFDGILGLVGNVPLLGRLLKSIVVAVLSKRRRPIALPNILAGRSIVPEVVGRLTPEPVADALIELRDNDSELNRQIEAFTQFPVTAHAADAVCDAIEMAWTA